MAKTVEIDRRSLRTLADSLDAFWDDHAFAKTDDNPHWVNDREAIAKAREALAQKP